MLSAGPARHSKASRDVVGWLFFLILLCWAVLRIARSIQILFADSHDLYTYYSLWYVLCHRELADIALRQSLYLPHTWVFLTPFFVFGWPVARVLMLVVNLGAVVFLWWRLSVLAGLSGVRKALLLVMASALLGTGLVIGLGNLALVCVAAAVAAYPFQSSRDSVFLAFSAMKQTMVFPVYLHLLIRKPKALIIPSIIFAVAGVAALIWARLTPIEAIAMARGAVGAVGSWTQYDHTCLRRILVLFTSSPLVLGLLNWIIWFALFACCLRFLREGLSLLAALMLLSLLPLYHNIYDMVAAIPALAVLLRRANLLPAVVLTVSLSTNLAAGVVRISPAFLKSAAHSLETAYYPVIILLSLGALFYFELRERGQASSVPGPGLQPPAAFSFPPKTEMD
jgi:hypothetical protein